MDKPKKIFLKPPSESKKENSYCCRFVKSCSCLIPARRCLRLQALAGGYQAICTQSFRKSFSFYIFIYNFSLFTWNFEFSGPESSVCSQFVNPVTETTPKKIYINLGRL